MASAGGCWHVRMALIASPSPFGALEMNQEKRGKDQMIIRELTIEQVRGELRKFGISESSVPYRGYATTLFDDGEKRRFIGHSPEGKYFLQEVTGTRNSSPEECF